MWMSSPWSGGVTEDFNNDGYIDIFYQQLVLGDNVHYFQNNGDGTFTDRTKEANLEGITGGLNLSMPITTMTVFAMCSSRVVAGGMITVKYPTAC